MYCKMNVSIPDRINLYDAIRECFRNIVAGVFSVVISEDGDNQFVLTPRQQQQLRENGGVAVIICHRNQIIEYAHTCMSRPQLMRILTGENPIQV